MKIYDYRIVECFDFDYMTTYYMVEKYNLNLQQYETHLTNRFPVLVQAKSAIQMLRRYKEPIYHYVD